MGDPRPTEPQLSSRVTAMPESTIREMYNLAQDHNGPLIRLEIGEPDFDTPQHIVKAAATAAENGATHYTHNAGLSELREAIAARTKQKNGTVVDPNSEILVTAGAVEAVYTALLSVVEPGGEVVLPTPAWPSYFTQAAALNLDLNRLPLHPDEQFDLSPRRLAETVTDKTEAIVLTSPSNPTGRIYHPEVIREVIDIAVEHDAYVIADEVYEDLAYSDKYQSVLDMDIDRSHVISVHSLSKTYAMTGWRVGWLIGPESVVSAGTKSHQGTITCASSVSQQAAIAALTGPQKPIDKMYEAFKDRRNYVHSRIQDIPSVACPPPEGGFYAFLDVRSLGGSSVSVAKQLLSEYGVVTVPGTGFGEAGEGHLRLSFANDKDSLATAFDNIESMVRSITS